MKKKLIVSLAFFLLSVSSNAQHAYSLYKTIPVADNAGWDYVAVDEVNRNIYFSHATKVLIASADHDEIIATIPNTFGVHGIAFDQELNKGFISNGKANSVTVFNLKTFAVIDTVAVTGEKPDAILYDAYSKKVFAFNGKTNNATVIDPVSLKVVASIALPGKPEFAVTNLAGKVYVNMEDKSEVVEIDAMDFKVLKIWPIAPGEEPSGLAIDRVNNLLFSVCANKQLVVFDIAKSMVIDSIKIGGMVDAVVFNPKTKMIYSSNGEGNLTVIKQLSPAVYKTVQVLNTQKGSKTMALDSKTGKLYLPAALFEGDTKKIVAGSFKILVFK